MSGMHVLLGLVRRGFCLNRNARALTSAAFLLALIFALSGGCGGGDNGTKPGNEAPTINGVLMDPRHVAPGDTVSATVIAGDPEGAPLTYLWHVNAGRLLDSLSSQATWVAPAFAASCSLTVTASDGAEQTSFTSVVPVGIGTLVIESYPQGATVYIDEEASEYVTPATIGQAAAGTYSIRVSQAGFGYYPASRSANVANGATTTVMFGLNQGQMTVTQLNSPVNECSFQTSWSPDGTQLACAVENTVAQYRKIEIFKSPWPDFTGDFLETTDQPDWGPSWGVGNKILFASSRGGGVPRVYSVPLTGGTPTLVYPTEANFPAWSWDAQQMAFVARNGGVHDLIVKPASGPGLVTAAQGVVEDRPTWKPDNTTIAFSKLVDGNPYIFTVPAAGGTAVQVSHVPGTHPQWSPDGSKIAFVSSYGGSTGVWILFMDKGPEPLDGWLTTSGEDWPTWKPVSNFLCYNVTTSTNCQTAWMAQNYPF